MNNASNDKAWEILIARKNDRKESRIAFIAALILAKSGDAQMRSRIALGKESAITPHTAAAYAAEFVRLARIIHSEAEAACSFERSPAQVTRGENAEARFRDLAEALGFEARTGGDPRGACAYLIDPDDRKGDGWGEGWAVYA